MLNINHEEQMGVQMLCTTTRGSRRTSRLTVDPLNNLTRIPQNPRQANTLW